MTRSTLAGAAALLAVLQPLPVAFAAEPMLEEIVVTAQRREQNIQDVPIAVTAFSGADLEKSNITGAVDYLARTPNVSFTEDGQSGSRGLGVAIRGVNNLVSGENAFINSVGIYLDEFSVASVPNQVANPFLPDMERVEVLRGPQGTLFGRNSLGGALNLVTKAPTDEFEGNIKIGGETYDDAGEMGSVAATVNLPVSETFAIRGTFLLEDSSGLVENINPLGEQDSGHTYFMGRIKARADLSDRTTLNLTIIHSDEEQGHDENVPSGVLDLDTVDTLGIQSAIDPGTGFWPRNRNELSHDLDERNELQSTVVIASLTHEFSDTLTMKWVTGLIDAEQDRLFDNDLIGGVDALVRTNFYEGRSWSTELRFEGTSDNVSWVAGVLYAQDDQKQSNNVATSSDPTATINGIGFLPPFPSGLGLALNNKNFEVESLAVFGDVTWSINDRLDLVFGGRYTSDDVTNEVTSFGIAPMNPPAPPPDPAFFGSFGNFPRPEASADESFTDFSPRLGIRYNVSDTVNVYGTVSKGYKAGGSSVGNNTNTPGNDPFIVPFDEETLWNYEIGFKGEFADRRVRLNAALFYLDWSDLQLEAFRFLTPGDLSSNFEQTVNIDEAEAWGAELELVAAVSENFTIGANIGVLDTEITSNSTAEITGGFVVSLKGEEIPKSPEYTANLWAEYAWQRDFGEIWVRAEFIARDGQYSDVEGLTNEQTRGPSPNQGLVRAMPRGQFPYESPDYEVWNLRAGLELDNFSAVAYIQNVADEEYYTGTQENFGASGIRLRPHPRVIGANITYRF